MRRSVVFGCLLLIACKAAGESRADAEVRYLLEYVAQSGCTFHRNGRDYDAASAAEHLQLKYQRGARYVNSAEQFIDRLASESSWSGEAYSVTCGDRTEPTNRWLHRALDNHRD